MKEAQTHLEFSFRNKVLDATDNPNGCFLRITEAKSTDNEEQTKRKKTIRQPDTSAEIRWPAGRPAGRRNDRCIRSAAAQKEQMLITMQMHIEGGAGGMGGGRKDD